jgi:hypothetical protein
MKTYNTEYGIFYQKPYFRPDHFEEIAAQALQKAGYSDSEPGEIPIEDVLEECLGLAVKYSPLPAGVMGCAHFEPVGVVEIEIHESLAHCGEDLTLDRRRRSTVAHELGHGLLHTSLYQQRFEVERRQADFDPVRPQRDHIACRSVDICEVGTQQASGISYSWMEWQANALMGPLLVPRHALWRHLEPWVGRRDGIRALELPASARAEAEESCSEVFHVSRQLAGIRLDGLFPRVVHDQLDLFAEVSA